LVLNDLAGEAHHGRIPHEEVDGRPQSLEPGTGERGHPGAHEAPETADPPRWPCRSGTGGGSTPPFDWTLGSAVIDGDV
jgi:hypothetical protein